MLSIMRMLNNLRAKCSVVHVENLRKQKGIKLIDYM